MQLGFFMQYSGCCTLANTSLAEYHSLLQLVKTKHTLVNNHLLFQLVKNTHLLILEYCVFYPTKNS